MLQNNTREGKREKSMEFSYQAADGSDCHLLYLAAKQSIEKCNFTASYNITKAILAEMPKNLSFLELYAQSLLGLNDIKQAQELFSWLGDNIYKTIGLSIAYFDFLAKEGRYGESLFHVWNSIKANQSEDLLQYFRAALDNLAEIDSDFLISLKDLSYSDPSDILSSVLLSFSGEFDSVDISGLLNDHMYDCQTREISERFLPFAKDERSFLLELCSADFVRARLEAAPVGNVVLPDSEIGFSVLTPYFAHKSFFVECAKSVAAAAVRVDRPVEWVVFNDDPTMPDDQLKSLIPEALQRQVRIVSDGQNHGIAVAQNRAAAAASYTWLVLLDCDDLLEPQALEALETAIIEAPGTRYFSSLMIDIDESGAELRRRRREHMPSDLFREGMIMGHMVAVRRDLFDALQGFDPRFSGVQDYHFALRVAQREQIGCLPMHLYRYRWHERTQSVSGAFRQAKLSDAVRSAFLNESLGVERPEPLTTTDLALIPRALCVVRTQGGRMELLENTLASIRAQSLQITPCIVVHGDDDLHDFVKRQLTKQSLPDEAVPAVILKAPNTSRKRGYPCNVALDYLEKNRDTYDLLCFLDDDDHYLPGFADRLVHLMRATEADVAYCATNALPKTGEPVGQHKLLPFTALLAGNFIPFNSFLVRTEAVFAARARFNETLHYLEDYDFLVQLLLAGVRAEPLHETLSEYRLLGDGNSTIKQDVACYQECEEQVRLRIAGAALSKPASATIRSSALTEEAFIADVMAFPFKTDTGQWGDQEFTHLKAAYDVLKQLRRKNDQA